MDKINWERWADRLYLVLILFGCLWWASRNSDPNKLSKMEDDFTNVVAQVKQFAGDTQTRLGALEKAVIPTQQPQAPGLVPKK